MQNDQILFEKNKSNGLELNQLAVAGTTSKYSQNWKGMFGATGNCPCQRHGCFSFNATHDPHVVILCDCHNWSV
jgi:hypothetical protein